MALNATSTTDPEKGRLPDSVNRDGPFRTFSSDPGWNEAWWWLGIPVVAAITLAAFGTFATEFYLKRILPEGYGALELAHFFIPIFGMIIAVRLLFRPFVRQHKLIFVFLCLAAFSCLYIAGEEHSWGQHFFHWQTPEYWSQVNRQQETNLHNTLHLFDKKPRALLEIGILIGGLIIPALARYRADVRRNRWSLFFPPDAIVPTALCALLFKIADTLRDNFHTLVLVPRPSEATELFLYFFLLFYLIMFARRIDELEREPKHIA